MGGSPFAMGIDNFPNTIINKYMYMKLHFMAPERNTEHLANVKFVIF